MKAFVKSALSNPDGTASLTHVLACLFAIVWVLCAGLKVVHHTPIAEWIYNDAEQMTLILSGINAGKGIGYFFSQKNNIPNA